MEKVNRIRGLWMLAWLAALMPVVSWAAERMELTADTIAARFDNQRYMYPQEKLHVVTDKEEYIAGSDSIWLRIFVVDAASHKPVDVSRYVYVELRDPMNRVTDRVKVMCRNGIYAGCIPLYSALAEGDYMLSAYTRFAESAGEKYFFKKNVKVYSPYRVVSEISLDIDSVKGLATIRYTDIATGEPKKFGVLECLTLSGNNYESQNGKGGKRIKVDAINGDVVMVRFDHYARYFTITPPLHDFDVTFHPEGGYMIAGEPCRIAFKAVDSSGRGCDVTVRVTDSDGHEIATSSSVHRGMGMMVMVPEAGVRYSAEAVDGNGFSKVFDMPMATTGRSVIRVDNRAGTLSITTAGVPVTDDGFVVLQCRGNMIMHTPVVKSQPINVDKRLLPEGIIQALLIDSRGTVLSDRLVFVAHDDGGNTASLTLPLTAVSTRSVVEASVSMPDGMPAGDFAVTVTDNDKVTTEPSTDIRAQLLLQGDLTGHVEYPLEYFTDPTDSQMRLALDILMMTQGWHRYDIPDMLAGRMTEPKSYIEQGQELTGIVKSRWRGKPMTDATINALAPKAGYAGTAMTDADGRFHLSGVDFPEDTKFVFQALNRKGDNEDNFDIDDPEYPTISLIAADSPKKSKESDDEEPIDEMIRRNDKLNVMLKEVTVTAQKRRKYEDIYEVLARRSFGPEDFAERKVTKIEEVLRLIAGLDADRLTYRGSPVTIFIDGIRWHDLEENDQSILGISGSNRLGVLQSMVGPLGSKKSSRKGGYVSQSRQANAPMAKVISENHKYMQITEVVPFMNVKRIDFIQPNEAVFLGSDLYGGALVITTNDGSGTNQWVQPDNLQIYIPLGYQKPVEFYSPKYESDNKYDEVPDGMDRRSTVYWNPSVRTGSDGRATFSFYTTDNPRTTYTVRVEGLTDDGTPFRSQSQLKIRNDDF